MTALEITALLTVVISPFAGSFLGLLVDRLPRDEPVVIARSACRSCGTALAPHELIPLVSFALARGRCRSCAAPIPRWLPLMEIAALALALLAVVLGRTPAEIALFAGLLWTLLALAAADLMWFRLPDPLTATLLVLALACAYVTGWPPLPLALWGAAIGAGSFLAIRIGYHRLRHREGLGLGDVKLMAGLGAALGPLDLPLMVLTAALCALAAALAGRVTSPEALSATRPMPFGAALAAAGGVIWAVARLPG